MISNLSSNNSSMNSVLQNGLQGLQNSTQSINDSAQAIASVATSESDSTSSVDLAEPLINMRQQQHLFDASAKVVKVADEALGALIDIKT